MRLPVAVRNIPLPESHLTLLGAGVALQAIRPLRLPGASSRTAALVVGALLGSGVAVIGAAASAAGRVDLAVPNRLVTSGPYAISRHPMYEAWTALYGALALALRNGWLAVLLPILLALVQRETTAEECALRARFGEAHAAYAGRTPRYVVLWVGRLLGG